MPGAAPVLSRARPPARAAARAARGCRPARLDATEADQPEPPALAVAAGRKNSFAMIILATVFAGGCRADWAGNFVSLVVGSYVSCCELHLAAVKGGAACDCEIAFIVSLMPARMISA